MMVESDTPYCRTPFEKIVIMPSGKVHPCCPTWLGKSIGNIFHESELDRIWNSDAAQEIRDSIVNGTYKYCNHAICPFLISEIYPVGKPVKEVENVLSQGPTILTIDYDYTCNLRCRFCRKGPIPLSEQGAATLLQFQEGLIRSPLARELRELILAGQGEVFASKIYLSLLRSIQQENFPHLKITLLTNGTLLTPAMWQTIANVHYAIHDIKISIDAATPRTYEKIRLGGDHAVLQRNIRHLVKQKRSRNIRLFATFVVQTDNFREMPAFVRKYRKLGFDHIYFSTLVDFDVMGKEEFQRAAIHRPDHPEYNDFLRVLADPILQSPDVSVKIRIPNEHRLTPGKRWNGMGWKHLWALVRGRRESTRR